MGLAAGTTAKAADLPRPTQLKDIPGIEAILDKSDNDLFFFPSSYVEGFVVAYDNPGWKFIPAHDDNA
jgi:hypothetical protein